MKKMKIKKGDTVIITAGKDRGKEGKILDAFPQKGRVIVDGLNLRKRHHKPRKSGQKGQTIEFAAPMHISNVMIKDNKTGKPTRIGYKIEGDKKIRISKKSGLEL